MEMEFAQMTQKWSSKPKEDRAARVRENQRRHRARTKAYIADLEQQLEDTKRKLDDALMRNTELVAEVGRLKQRPHQTQQQQAPLSPPSDPPPGTTTVVIATAPQLAAAAAAATSSSTTSISTCGVPRIGTCGSDPNSGGVVAILTPSSPGDSPTTAELTPPPATRPDNLAHDASLLLALGEEQLSSSSPPAPLASLPSWAPVATTAAAPVTTFSSSSCSSSKGGIVAGSCEPSSSSRSVPPSALLTPPTTTDHPGSAASTASASPPCACDTPIPTGPSSPNPDDTTSDTVMSGTLSRTRTTTSDPDCTHLPAPAPGESTIHCKTALRIIEERNFKGVDVNAIQSWLGPGFRRAIIQGDGCRVDSHLVFALIDDISGTD